MIPAAHNMINRYSVSNTVQEVLQQLEGCRKLTLRKKKTCRKIYKDKKYGGEKCPRELSQAVIYNNTSLQQD